MQFLANIKLSRKTMIVAIVPIVAMMIFSTQIALREVERSHAAGDLGHLTALAVKMSKLVHEQQKERGATAVYVGSSGAKFASELASQRQQTDKKREELKSYLSGFDPEKYGETFNRDFQAVMATLGKMDGIRKNVDALSISAPEAIGYYTGLNGQNLKLVEFMGGLSPDTVIFSRFVGYSNFLQSKERAGLERAVGANGFASGKFTPKAMDKFKRLIAIQDTYNEGFLTQATDGQKALFNEVMSSDATKEVQRMREVAFTGGLDGELQGITEKTWFDTITQKIDGLKGIEDSLSQNLLDDLARLEAAAVSNKWLAIGAALITLALVIGFCLTIIRSINVSFRTIISAMVRLADGNLDVTLPSAKANEIGEMVNAVQVFKDNAIEKVELEHSLAKEKELNELQRQFVSMASHEFRTPLAIIDATAQRMKSRAVKNRLTPEDAVRRVEKIRAAVGRMTRLMDSTLTAARLEEGKIPIKIAPCDVATAVMEVCARQQEISQTHVISCDLAGLPDTIQADEGALERIITNLLSNAVKYAPGAPDIEVRAHTEGDQVVISVRDQGLGIDGDELPRIGERFFRARTSTGIAGTGIGLHMVKTLAKMHGGRVSVESKKGGGSTFTVRLPIAGPDQTEQADTRAA